MVEHICGNHAAGRKFHPDLFFVALNNDDESAVFPQNSLVVINANLLLM
jgi:hypothetical protein